MLLDSHPGYESLVVPPDYPRYRDLAHRTKSGRAAAVLHVVFIAEDGSATSDTWTV
jgi:predicted amidohydrolase